MAVRPTGQLCCLLIGMLPLRSPSIYSASGGQVINQIAYLGVDSKQLRGALFMSQAHVSQPSLAAVRAFEAAARLESFTAAAAEIGLTQSAISRHILSLEARFGTPLFLRNGRRVKLTEAGHAYFVAVADTFVRLRDANVAMAARARPEDRVTLSLLPSLAALWLAPRLAEFAELYPKIDLRIHASRTLIDFERDGIDMTVRYGQGEWPHVRTELLATETLTLVCAPNLAGQFKSISVHEWLRSIPLLVDDIPDGWSAWLRAAEVSARGLRYGSRFNESASLYQAVAAGAGAALGRSFLVRRDLAQGRLVAPIPISIPASFGYWLAYP